LTVFNGDLATESAVPEKYLAFYEFSALKTMHYDIFNLGETELLYGITYLQEVEKDNPIFISANLINAQTKNPLFPPYQLKSYTVTLDGNKKTKIKVAILGLLGISQQGKVQQYLDTDSTRVILADPVKILPQYLPLLREKADLIIALAHMPAIEAESLAQQFPQIDILISGHDPQDQVINLKKIGRTIVVHGRDRSRFGEALLLYLDKKKGIDSYRQQETLLSTQIANDPLVGALVKQYRTTLATLSPKPELVAPGAQDPNFVGAQACQSCHQEAYQIWEKSPHANAYTSLKKSENEKQFECLRCHTLGVGRTDGFISIEKTPNLVGVQCESCHHPGSFHIQAPLEKKKETIASPHDAKICLQCHTKETAPDFSYLDALKYINHKK
jgi:hypothetical protein